ncbi:hypothetical protein R1T16_16710 [Flavobacterium sp. DG1-102-2]|uniref:hypothetical protein n=1 Tax=Flavobacterium sp. DG1-102-2 TaxID=3081663 RepID=UPI002948E515|nr:hypothetical protein [Flavobacterium sp. DG1-102-2]MDV6170082.1 hypothetical protein [Flavobacterium sp. DG1-102-2]
MHLDFLLRIVHFFNELHSFDMSFNFERSATESKHEAEGQLAEQISDIILEFKEISPIVEMTKRYEKSALICQNPRRPRSFKNKKSASYDGFYSITKVKF